MALYKIGNGRKRSFIRNTSLKRDKIHVPKPAGYLVQTKGK